MFNERWDSGVDKVFQKLLERDIVALDRESWMMAWVEFSGGIVLKFWDANKYYAWCDFGVVKAGGVEFEWHRARPKRKTMAKFYRKLRDYEQEQGKVSKVLRRLT